MLHRFHLEIPRESWRSDVLSRPWLGYAQQVLSSVAGVKSLSLHEIQNKSGEPIRIVLTIETSDEVRLAGEKLQGFHFAVELALRRIEPLEQARLLAVET